MTKEEIREGITALHFNFGHLSSDAVDILFAYLHSQGVVIKVDRGLPDTPYDSSGELPSQFDSDETATDMDVFLMHCNGIEKGKSLMLKAGYVAWKPLIE